MEVFKKCNVIYFKTQKFPKLLDRSLKGKIIISDFHELSRICTVNGLIHILNTSIQKIPSNKTVGIILSGGNIPPGVCSISISACLNFKSSLSEFIFFCSARILSACA